MQSKWALVVLAIAVAGAVAAPFDNAEAASQYVVISAEPPVKGFEPGRVLNVADTIDVPEGAVITLLGEDGSITPVPGPARITVTEDEITTSRAAEPKEENRGTLSRLADLLAGENKSADSLGVSRNLNKKKEAPKLTGLDDPWVLSVNRSASACHKGGTMRFGRATATDDSVLLISATAKEPVRLEWKKGDEVIDAPQIAEDAKEIEVRLDGKAALLDVRMLPSDISEAEPMKVLGWMLEQRCDGQALALVKSLSRQAQ